MSRAGQYEVWCPTEERWSIDVDFSPFEVDVEAGSMHLKRVNGTPFVCFRTSAGIWIRTLL